MHGDSGLSLLPGQLKTALVTYVHKGMNLVSEMVTGRAMQ